MISECFALVTPYFSQRYLHLISKIYSESTVILGTICFQKSLPTVTLPRVSAMHHFVMVFLTAVQTFQYLKTTDDKYCCRKYACNMKPQRNTTWYF